MISHTSFSSVNWVGCSMSCTDVSRSTRRDMSLLYERDEKSSVECAYRGLLPQHRGQSTSALYYFGIAASGHEEHETDDDVLFGKTFEGIDAGEDGEDQVRHTNDRACPGHGTLSPLRHLV